GHHGLFSLTPVWLLSAIGALWYAPAGVRAVFSSPSASEGEGLGDGGAVLSPPPLRGRARAGGEAPRAAGPSTPLPSPPPQGPRGRAGLAGRGDLLRAVPALEPLAAPVALPARRGPRLVAVLISSVGAASRAALFGRVRERQRNAPALRKRPVRFAGAHAPYSP